MMQLWMKVWELNIGLDVTIGINDTIRKVEEFTGGQDT
jgi:hypothetical protein